MAKRSAKQESTRTQIHENWYFHMRWLLLSLADMQTKQNTKTGIVSLLLLLVTPLLWGQAELFERQPGIKTISIIELKGNQTKLDSTIKKVLHYDESGRLIELDLQYNKYRYEYLNDSTAISTSSRNPDCRQQHSRAREGDKLVSRLETLPDAKGCEYAPSESMVFGLLRADSLFAEVPRSTRKKGREYITTVRLMGEQAGEWTDYSYSKKGSQLRLSHISQYVKVSDGYFVQRIFVVGYPNVITLEHQQLVDEEKFRVEQLSNEELITEVDASQFTGYVFARDAQGNWVSRKPQNMTPERQQYTVRVIQYW
ncbi:MAG: hypothetical protein AAFQ68_19210 [Bacteroidota bacterium]